MLNYLETIKEKLIELKPYKAVLFGSYAYGKIHGDSDIDLIVVLDIEDMPKSFSERMENHSKVRSHLRLINQEVPMDILVYTKHEWEKLIELDTSFTKEILKKGKPII